MTEVKIYGLLSKEFGSSFKFHLGKVNDVVNAIDCIKPNFRERINKLQNDGYIYSLQTKGNSIVITPVIHGFGRTFAKVFSIFLVVVGVVLMFLPGAQQLGFSLIMSGIQLGMAAFFPPKIKFPNRSYSVGGSAFASDKNGKSYIFSNITNSSYQGSLVRMGYGKFLIGSQLIQASVKNYKTSQTFIQENYFAYSEPESSTFIESSN